MAKTDELQQDDNDFWRRTFFSEHKAHPLRRGKHDLIAQRPEKIADTGNIWLKQLFEGRQLEQEAGDKLRVLKSGVVVYEIPLQQLKQATLIGRHPDADLQLESQGMAMFHAVILKKDGKFYIENLDGENGIVIQRKRLKLKTPVQLYDGTQVDMPGYQLAFAIANAPDSMQEADFDSDGTDDLPGFYYQSPPPRPGPLLSHLVDDIRKIDIWNEGVTRLKVADIIEETHNCKTFRLVGEQPLLFSYKPGQFITFILNIDGKEVRRSYSMSSSPSRPHLLEVTVKRVPGGLVSNWFCDRVKLGDVLTVKGPVGKFTCFNYPSHKMLFIGAGSGITPILSMSRWITDTASHVDVKLLASFKSPQEIIFRKEFELLSARSRGFQVAVTVTSGWNGTDFWTGYTGRVNQHMLNMFVPDIHERDIFLCGPEPFADTIKSLLSDMNYDMSRFHTESFGSSRSAQASADVDKSLRLQGTLHKVTFTQSGKTVDTDENTTLLELAEAHGIEIDYSCRVGSCGECEVKCRGDVNIKGFCEIDEKTRNAGFIYTCCSTAASDLELDV